MIEERPAEASPVEFIKDNTPSMAPADWCSYNPSLKCIPIIANSSPPYARWMSNGLVSPWVGSKNLKIASGLRKMSLGPMKPYMALLMQVMAASVERAADAPLESDNCLPALMALKGM